MLRYTRHVSVTCFDVSVPGEEFQGAFEAPDTTLATPEYPVHAAVVVTFQVILNERNHGSN